MKEFRTCPNCGYTRGFHVSFKKNDTGCSVIFICPECGSSYDLNLTENRLSRLEPRRGETYPWE